MTALERAFQLARSGQVSQLKEIVSALRREGYSPDQIQGRALRRQLADLIKTARERDLNADGLRRLALGARGPCLAVLA